jgi:ribosome-binding factor A
MPNRRAARVARRIQQEASQLVLYGLRDPRLELVTITRAEISNDLRHATVFFSVLGSEGKRRAAERGLDSASGLIRSHIAKSLGLREAPAIAFQFDPSIEKAIEISKLIDQVVAERGDSPPDAGPPEEEAPAAESPDLDDDESPSP